MRARWPLKQTMPIRWSAPAWRPRINFGGAARLERPSPVRIVRPPVTGENHQNDGGAESGLMWI